MPTFIELGHRPNIRNSTLRLKFKIQLLSLSDYIRLLNKVFAHQFDLRATICVRGKALLLNVCAKKHVYSTNCKLHNDSRNSKEIVELCHRSPPA